MEGFRLKIEDRLFLVKFNTDKLSHLRVIEERVCRECSEKPCLAFCPAKVYGWDDKEAVVTVGYEGCFECGACRVGCPHFNIEWRYPRGGYGVAFRHG